MAAKEDNLAELLRLLGEDPSLLESKDNDVRQSAQHRGSVTLHRRLLPSPSGRPLLIQHARLCAVAFAHSQLNYTPLHWAAWNDNVEMAKALLEKGARTDAQGLVREPRPPPLPRGSVCNTCCVAAMLFSWDLLCRLSWGCVWGCWLLMHGGVAADTWARFARSVRRVA